VTGRRNSPNCMAGEVAEKLRFWVAQRFQRCDKALSSMRALAPEVLKLRFSAASGDVPPPTPGFSSAKAKFYSGKGETAFFRTKSFYCSLVAALLAVTLLPSCGHPKQAHQNVPPPPPIPPTEEPSAAESGPGAKRPKAKARSEDAAGEADLAEPTIPDGTVPLSSETGMASWYGPPYHNRRGSNGQVYNMNAMTAAHRTLPLGSIVRVTNVKTGHHALVRITDRGPFIPGRVLDLSLAAARKIDVYQPGVAKVRVEVMQTPASLASGGKWAVQIGGLSDQHAAKLADHLTRRYRTAKVLRFASPAGDWWVRVRVLDDYHDRAQKLAAETRTPEGAIFLVRLD
jgi:peptidoglycan lytic transglycosylase